MSGLPDNVPDFDPNDRHAAKRILLTMAADQWAAVAKLRAATPGERLFAQIMEAQARTMLAELPAPEHRAADPEMLSRLTKLVEVVEIGLDAGLIVSQAGGRPPMPALTEARELLDRLGVPRL